VLNQKSKITIWGMLLLLAFVWGSSFILMKIAIFDTSGEMVYTPLEVAALRYNKIFEIDKKISNTTSFSNWHIGEFVPRVFIYLGCKFYPISNRRDVECPYAFVYYDCGRGCV
jgi:hypothetical protein